MAWYALHTKPKQEDRVSSRLMSMELEVLLPRIQVRRRERGNSTTRVEPLFPGYLFVSASLTPQVWDAVRWTPGVKAILGCGGVPSQIPDDPIALIKQRVGLDGVIRPKDPFGPGKQVRIKNGPFAGLIGIMERPTSRVGRVRVLLQVLHGATIELEDVDLELAS